MTARTYTVGLPVVITVHEDGRVHASVDMADFSEAMWEDANLDFRTGPVPTDDEVTEDVAWVTVAYEARAITCGVMHQEPVVHSEELTRFLAQNERTTATILPEQVAMIGHFAEHHSGGLYVLGRELDDGRYVKMHDSWGDDEYVVVHAYDPMGASRRVERDDEEETYFKKGSDAILAFLYYEERLNGRLCRYCGEPEGKWDAAECSVSEHSFHIPFGASDLIHLAGEGTETACGTVQEAITVGDPALVDCSVCQQVAGIDPDHPRGE